MESIKERTSNVQNTSDSTESQPDVDKHVHPSTVTAAGLDPSRADDNDLSFKLALPTEIERELREAFRQKQLTARPPLEPVESNASDHSVIQSGLTCTFTNNTFCCTVCNCVLPASSFYPSNLRRSAFYCKTCCRQQAQAHRDAKKRRAPTPSDDCHSPSMSQTRFELKRAENMLNRLRRMCAKPEKGGFRKLLTQPVSLGFGARMTRRLLTFWCHQSALSVGAAPVPEALRWLPWTSSSESSILQPWEIVPVTRQESRRLCAIPRHLWKDCLQPDVSARVEARLIVLQRVLVTDDSVCSDKQHVIPGPGPALGLDNQVV